jgi:hypothetical protein
MLSNLGNWGMAAEDGPRLDAHSAVREFALHPKWRAPAITPDVPFCAAARVATVVVLARHSVLGRRREIADSAHADIRRRYQSLWSLATALCAGTAYPVTSLLAQVACASNGTSRACPTLM